MERKALGFDIGGIIVCGAEFGDGGFGSAGGLGDGGGSAWGGVGGGGFGLGGGFRAEGGFAATFSGGGSGAADVCGDSEGPEVEGFGVTLELFKGFGFADYGFGPVFLQRLCFGGTVLERDSEGFGGAAGRADKTENRIGIVEGGFGVAESEVD